MTIRLQKVLTAIQDNLSRNLELSVQPSWFWRELLAQMEEGQPQSPGGPPLRPEDCVEELLKFTLQSLVTGTLGGGLDIGLSKEYCSNLLQHDHHDHPSSPSSNSASPTPPEFSQGVPLYPLYKLLASALCHSIASGALITPQYRNMAFIQEDSSRKQKEDEWIQLVMEKGSELLNVT